MLLLELFYDVFLIFYIVKMKIRTRPNCLVNTFADRIIKLIKILEANQPFNFSPILCIEIIKIVKKMVIELPTEINISLKVSRAQKEV